MTLDYYIACQVSEEVIIHRFSVVPLHGIPARMIELVTLFMLWTGN